LGFSEQSFYMQEKISPPRNCFYPIIFFGGVLVEFKFFR